MLTRTILRSALICTKEPLYSRLTPLHTTTILQKVKKHENKEKKVDAAMHHASQAASKNDYVKGALKEMTDCNTMLGEQLVKHFSVKVDTRLYEDILVPIGNGQEVRLSHIARVSLKGTRMVAINMSDSPTHIKEAKIALQKAGSIASSVQQEGVYLYIQVPAMSRERREQLAADAQKIVFSQYKDALNKIYSKYDKKATANLKTDDEGRLTRSQLLELKKALETKGHELVEAKKVELLREVV